jgi:gliding motility-associated lipoprotein GldD
MNKSTQTVPSGTETACKLCRGLLFPVLVLLVAGPLSCRQVATPKPQGYVRIKLPEKAYRLYDGQKEYSFEIPVYSEVRAHRGGQSEPGWIDIVVPQLNGKIYLSYKPVHGNLTEYITDSRTLAYKHAVKAEEIEETPFIEREEHRFGMIYDLKGNVASAVQFFITDSTTHFLRGSLYFDCPANQDSLRPVVEFMREDIVHLIETTRWKYE